MINIAVMGHGVVGSGVVEVLTKNCASITEKARDEINIKYVLDLRDFDELSYKDKFIKNFDTILADDDIKIVVEVMGGTDPAYKYVKSCLENGKDVVTSNKELVAAKGAELLKIASENNVNFLFEASVGGGIPVLRPIAQCLAANDIYEIVGILNGTTNFILTKMIEDNMSFEDALSLAQRLGYAERNPAADVEGGDACRKICILASLAFGKHVYPENVSTEGITKISLKDVESAASRDYAIKLVGRAKLLDDGHLIIGVYPALVHKTNLFYSVNDVFNAVMVRGDAVGDVLFYGRGAGKLPTASAVVGDIIDCVKHQHARKYLFWEDEEKGYVCDGLDADAKLYVRAKSDNVLKAKENIVASFGNTEFLDCETGEIAFITPVSTERTLRKELSNIDGIDIISVFHVID